MASARFFLAGREVDRQERRISRASSSIERPCWAAWILNRVLVFSSSRRIVRVAMSLYFCLVPSAGDSSVPVFEGGGWTGFEAPGLAGAEGSTPKSHT